MADRDLSWQDRAACQEIGWVPFFPEKGENPAEALRICAGCEVREQCLSYALAAPESWPGVWGGTSEEARRRLRRQSRREPSKEGDLT